jgi:hypothetical protein
MKCSRMLQYNITNRESHSVCRNSRPFHLLNEGNIDFTVKGFYLLNRNLLVQFAPSAAGVGEEGEATTNWGLVTPEQELNRINH